MVVRMKCFYLLLKTELFYSCILPLPYIVILEIGIEFSITDLISTKLILYRYSYFWFIVSKLPFLNVLLDNNSNQGIITSVNHKKTYTGSLTNYYSFVPFSYKLGLVRTIVGRTFKFNIDLGWF